MAYNETIARERAAKNAVSSLKSLENKGVKEELYALKSESTHNSWQAQRNKSLQRRNVSQGYRENTRDNINTAGRRNDTCYCCAKQGHKAKCRHRFKNCNFCKRKGHLEAAGESMANPRCSIFTTMRAAAIKKQQVTTKNCTR